MIVERFRRSILLIFDKRERQLRDFNEEVEKKEKIYVLNSWENFRILR